NSDDEIFVISGTLVFSAGGTDSGFDGISAGATLAFSGGTYTLTSASIVSGDGGVTVTDGRVDVSGDFTPAGPVAISGSDFTHNPTLNLTSSVNGTGSVTITTLTLQNGTLTGDATVNVTGGFSWNGAGTMTGT